MSGPGRPGCAPRPPRIIADFTALDADIAAALDGANYAPRTAHLGIEEQRKFAAWCAHTAGDIEALPALPITVASYLAWMAVGSTDEAGEVLRAPYARSTIRIARTGIGLAHRRAGYASPTADPYVERVMRGISRCSWVRGPRQQAALTHDLLLKLVTLRQPLPPVTSLRDRAAVLVARATGQTLLEVAATPRAAVRVRHDHAVVNLPSGQMVLPCRCSPPIGDLLCPVSALRELDADLPMRAELAFGVVNSTFRRGGSLAYPAAHQAKRAAQAIHAAVAGAGGHWPLTAAMADLDDDATSQLLATLDPSATRWARDSALLLVGWHLALRGGEIGGLDLANINRDTRGWTLMLGRTKNDALGAGTPLSLLPTRDPRLDPVAALDAWMARRGNHPGTVFTPLRGGRPRFTGQLSTATISAVVRERAAAAGLIGGFSSHSLRIGFVVSALRLGASIPDVMTVTRHRDPEMVGYYGRGELSRRSRAAWKALASARHPGATE